MASIRRIIEDSDTTVERPSEQSDTDPAQGPEQAASNVEVEPETMDLAEVDRFRGAIDGDATAGEPDSPSGQAAEADIEMSSQAGDIQPFPAPAAVAARRAAADAVALELAGEPDDDAVHATAPNGRDAVPRAPQPGDMGDADTGQAIISEKAGRQVAAAFEELSEAFAASRRRSLDEMAEEMLRPMLREWMDNNLPMLVERLVREEIERVARGN